MWEGRTMASNTGPETHPGTPEDANAALREQLAARMAYTLPQFGVWATTIRDFETPYGKIGIRQVEVLYALRKQQLGAGSVSPSQLSEYFHVQPSAITRVLNRLETSGFIERRVDPYDGRAQTIHVTERGEAISVAIEQIFLAQMQEAISVIPDQDLAETYRLIEPFAKIGETLLRMQERPLSPRTVADIRSERGFE
jgi:MarR family transcriptional regulator for hemolysin